MLQRFACRARFYSSEINWKKYNLSGFHNMCQLSRHDAIPIPHAIRTEAMKTIYLQKLTVNLIENVYDKSKYKINVLAPYGTYNPTTKCIDRSVPGTGENFEQKLPEHLWALQRYFALGKPDETLCQEATWKWMNDEFQNKTFGHIDKYKDTLDENNLTAELLSVVPYFTEVLQIMYTVLKHQLEHERKNLYSKIGYSLQNVYASGPDGVFMMRSKDVIAIEMIYWSFWTQWGMIDPKGPLNIDFKLPPNLQTNDIVKNINNKCYYHLHVVKKFNDISFPSNLELDNAKLINQEHVKEDWNKIRDFVFWRLWNDV